MEARRFGGVTAQVAQLNCRGQAQRSGEQTSRPHRPGATYLPATPRPGNHERATSARAVPSLATCNLLHELHVATAG